MDRVGAGGRQTEKMGGPAWLQGSHMRCTYNGCEHPTEKSHFVHIQGDSDAGCEYAGCEHPTESNRFYRIEGESTAGGQDTRFLERGTLEQTDRPRPLEKSERRCTYAGCKRPTESNYFYRIDGERTAGGQDWSGLSGSVLCEACYGRFKRRGTLERSDYNRPLAESEKRCTYDGCKRPTESSLFHRIDGEKTAGGQDWSGLTGRVLCNACYNQFRTRGTLERSDYNRPLAESERRCTYAGCERPTESRKFYRIDGASKAGGQDWSGLTGSVLCKTCYKRFLERGRLEQKAGGEAAHKTHPAAAPAVKIGDRPRPLAQSQRRCTYAGCERPTESSYFCRLDGELTAGGRSCSGLAGSVLCKACYLRFKRWGSLEWGRGDGGSGTASKRRKLGGAGED